MTGNDQLPGGRRGYRHLRQRGHPLLAGPLHARPHLPSSPREWRAAYEAGLFTEFMEQRAPGHTALDGTIYQNGHAGLQKADSRTIAGLDYRRPPAADKAEQLQAMAIACEAVIVFAERHAELAEAMAK
jgi:trans-4-hydroxy-L-proline dehydratase